VGVPQEWFARAPKLALRPVVSGRRDFFKLDPPAHVAVRYGTFPGL
jgi:hypothetical protein